jgi:hypothetical protein
MGGASRHRGRSGGLGAALAFLALALQLMFPAGTMAAPAGQGHGIPIVICSAEGRMVTDWETISGHKSKAPAKPMATCAFAGHATASPPPLPQPIPVAVAFATPTDSPRAFAIFPGRGLAAPPPPAIGPPLQV